MVRIPRRRDEREDGLTLIELLVSMGIFTIVIAVFMAGVVSMTRSTTHSQEVTDAGNAVRRAFQTMDKQIRYASAINFPGVAPVSGNHYVEFRTESQPNGLAPLCTQWRLNVATKELQSRTWRDPGTTRTAWVTMATNVRNKLTAPGSQPPFVLKPAGGNLVRQQLAVTVVSGRGTSPIGADTSTVFVARNSSKNSLSNADLVAPVGVSDFPVCSNLLERP